VGVGNLVGKVRANPIPTAATIGAAAAVVTIVVWGRDGALVVGAFATAIATVWWSWS